VVDLLRSWLACMDGHSESPPNESLDLIMGFTHRSFVAPRRPVRAVSGSRCSHREKIPSECRGPDVSLAGHCGRCQGRIARSTLHLAV
jgi:hypothetical protein